MEVDWYTAVRKCTPFPPSTPSCQTKGADAKEESPGWIVRPFYKQVSKSPFIPLYVSSAYDWERRGLLPLPCQLMIRYTATMRAEDAITCKAALISDKQLAVIVGGKHCAVRRPERSKNTVRTTDSKVRNPYFKISAFFRACVLLMLHHALDSTRNPRCNTHLISVIFDSLL